MSHPFVPAESRVLDREFAALVGDITSSERHEIFEAVANIVGGTRFRDTAVRLVQAQTSHSLEPIRTALVEATWTSERGDARSLMLTMSAHFGGGVMRILCVAGAEDDAPRMAA